MKFRNLIAAGVAGMAFINHVSLAASATAPAANAVTYDQGAMQARMRQKFNDMQSVHEGMLLGDWVTMEKALMDLLELAKSSTWANIRTGGYHRASGRFYEAAEDLLDAVKRKDGNAATLPYLRLTTSCLECHQQVRTKIGR
ncbi:MAG: hypothetical protein NTY08_14420 [Proteobacteria bacterium]|nr:hypothetical protein [Pseudomonadota bacterium]